MLSLLGAGCLVLSCWKLAGQNAQVPAAAPVSAIVLFRDSGCSHCHQWQGEGGHKGPDLTGVRKKLKVEAIRQQIVEGGGAMPAFGDALTPEQTDALVGLLENAPVSSKQ